MAAIVSPLRVGAPRAIWLTLGGIVAAVNMNAYHIVGGVQLHGLAMAAANLFGLNAAFLFALYGLWEIGQKEGARADAAPLARSDMAVIGAAFALSLVPWNAASLVALHGIGSWCVITGTRGSAERRAGLIMLATGGSVLAARLLLNSVGDSVVTLDAQIVAWVAGVPVHDNVVDFRNSGGRSFIIGLGCSSVHNMSQALLLWATATQLLRLRIDAELVLFGLAAMASMFLVNVARLVAIAWYPQHFDTIHEGLIAEIFGLVCLILAALIIGGGALHAHRRQV